MMTKSMNRLVLVGSVMIWMMMGIVSLPLSLQAQSKGEELDRFFKYYNQSGMFNGVVLAETDGKTIYEKAFGFADFEAKTPMTMASVISIGSMTKSMTAAAIMMLKEWGFLEYNDGILKYFPDFPSYMKSIMIRHLLTHTSGIVDYLGRGLRLLDKFPQVTDSMVLENLKCQSSLQFEPGSKFSYSNSNYVLLAQIIEKVSHKSYAGFIKDNILIPLEMNDSFVYEGNEELLKKSVKSYTGYWEFNKNNYHLKSKGDGNVYSTAGDLLKFARGFFSGRLAGAGTMQEALHDPEFKFRSEKDKSKYGFGWEIIGDPPDQAVYHRGSLAGFCGQIWRHLESHSTLIVLCNTPWLVEDPDILSGAENIMRGQPFILGKKSAAQLFWDNWYVRGFDAGWNNLKEALSAKDSDYYIHPWEIHWIGYSCLQRNEKQSSLEVFQYSLNLFPDDFNLLDSLGEAYLSIGDKTNAVKYYKKALEINPQCESSIKALKELGVIK